MRAEPCLPVAPVMIRRRGDSVAIVSSSPSMSCYDVKREIWEAMMGCAYLYILTPSTPSSWQTTIMPCTYFNHLSRTSWTSAGTESEFQGFSPASKDPKHRKR